MEFQIFTAWEEVRKVCNPDLLPEIHNDVFCLDTEKETAQTVFLWKSQAGISLLELLDREAEKESGESARLARQLYENELRAAQLVKKEDGMENFLSLLSCFTETAFVGAVFFHIPVQVQKKESFGTSFYTENTEFEATFVRIDGLAETGREKDCVLSGRIFGKKQEGTGESSFQALAVKAFFTGSRLMLVTGECSFLPVGLFGGNGGYWEPFELHGVYNGVQYHYTLRETVNYALRNSLLRSFSVEAVTVATGEDASNRIVKLKCGGKLRFERLSEAFDPFSYGPVSSEEDGYIGYDNLQITITQGETEKVEVNCGGILLKTGEAVPRKDSLWEQFAHGEPEFVCFQNGKTPEALGYRRIQCPAVQRGLGEQWYGIAVPVTLCDGVCIRLLFAFSGNQFFAGSSLAGNGSAAGLTFSLNELFKVHCTTIAILPYEREDKTKTVLLYLKGIRVSLFGLTFPPEACSIVWLARGSGNAPGWYAVYGKGKQVVKADGNEY